MSHPATIERLWSLIRQLQGLITVGEAGTAVTPTLTNVTLGTGGTNTQNWSRVGRMVFVDGRVVLGTGGSFTGSIQIAAPAAADHLTFGVASALDSSGSARTNGVCAANGSALTFGFPTAANATTPFTWAVGDTLDYQITYEAAS